jgi:hypothetical protein
MGHFEEEWKKAPIADLQDIRCNKCALAKEVRIFERVDKGVRGDEIHVAGCISCAGPWVRLYGYVACTCPELKNVKRES